MKGHTPPIAPPLNSILLFYQLPAFVDTVGLFSQIVINIQCMLSVPTHICVGTSRGAGGDSTEGLT